MRPGRSSLSRGGRLVILIALATILVGCVTRGAVWAPSAGSVGIYRRISVVPMLADTLDLVQPGQFFPPLVLLPAGWSTPLAAGGMVRDLLAPVGTEVMTVLPHGFPRPGLAGMRWPQVSWARLVAVGLTSDVQAILLLHQNALSAGGRECDLLTTLAGQSCIDDLGFQPAFIVVQNVGLDRAIAGEEARCLIGLDARLIDASTGQLIAAVDNIVAIEWRPHGLADGNRITSEEREALRPYCMSALRKAIAAAVRDLPLVRAAGGP